MLPLTKSNGLSPNQEKQPQTITLVPPNFTIDTIYSVKYRLLGIHQVHIRPSDCHIRNVTHHSIKPSSTAPQSNDGIVYIPPSNGEHLLL